MEPGASEVVPALGLDFRELVGYHQKLGRLKQLQKMVELEFEAAYYMKKYQPDPVLMNTRYGRLISNVLARRETVYEVVGGKSDSEVYAKFLRAMENPQPLSRIESSTGLKEVAVDLFRLPVPKFFERDGGRYITAGVFIAKDPLTGAVNASIHRAMILDEESLAVRLVPRHLYQIHRNAEKAGRNLPAAILIGAPPLVYLCAASSPPFGVYEVEVANALAGGRLTGTDSLLDGVVLPLPVEVVLLGEFIAGRRAKEGPFVDILGTYDIVREEPVFRVESILTRQDPLFYSILPSGLEHILLMGFPREAAIWSVASRTATGVRKVRLTPGGGGWLHAVISMEKTTEGDPKNVILAAFAAHPSLKTVVVVDADVDPDDPLDVEWALATRMQPDEDIVIIKGARGSSLDPSADQVTLQTSKLGIDATRPLSKDKSLFEKARIPFTEH
ncbi:UbiD family decarboxylase [Thermofilum pendens]|uniref:UbiD family decarboxylase n=1 Tax=Thermofilum pendens TaxID=2269 RepID=UPI00069BC0F1|nr:UbiD family decarboxylase [Thermofilum pendens]